MTTTAHHPQPPADVAHTCPYPETGCTARTCQGPAYPGLIRVPGGPLRIQGTVTIHPAPPALLAAAAVQIDRAWDRRSHPGPRRRQRVNITP